MHKWRVLWQSNWRPKYCLLLQPSDRWSQEAEYDGGRQGAAQAYGFRSQTTVILSQTQSVSVMRLKDLSREGTFRTLALRSNLEMKELKEIEVRRQCTLETHNRTKNESTGLGFVFSLFSFPCPCHKTTTFAEFWKRLTQHDSQRWYFELFLVFKGVFQHSCGHST